MNQTMEAPSVEQLRTAIARHDGTAADAWLNQSAPELALGLIRPGEFFHVVRKEMALGIINGIALGALLGLIAYLWKGNPALGGVVAAALAINTILAARLGGSIPLLLRGLGQDPALASGPILTTLTDMVGFFLVLSFASAALPWLTG